MSAVGYLTEAKDWSRALDGADTLDALRAVCHEWMPYVSDALELAEHMNEGQFQRFRTGLALERRRRKWRGQKGFAEQFGHIVIPDGLLKATLIGESLKAPLGMVLLQLEQAGDFRSARSGRAPASGGTE